MHLPPQGPLSAMSGVEGLAGEDCYIFSASLELHVSNRITFLKFIPDRARDNSCFVTS